MGKGERRTKGASTQRGGKSAAHKTNVRAKAARAPMKAGRTTERTPKPRAKKVRTETRRGQTTRAKTTRAETRRAPATPAQTEERAPTLAQIEARASHSERLL